MPEPVEKYDALEASYHRDNAAPLVFPDPKFKLRQLLRDADGDVIQIIGLEWCITQVGRQPYWEYTYWDVALGCVLDTAESLIEPYTTFS